MMRGWKSWAVAGLLVAGAVVRLVMSWQSRLITDPDASVVALMAKHIAEGRGVPVFFYGQAYMGSLEPLVSAALCRLFGVSGFAVNLGTAVVGFLLLPLVYLWARAAAGRTAGVAALAWVVLGPPGFQELQATPRGGYAVLGVLSAAVAMTACRIIVASRRSRPELLPWLALALGGLGGLGWWSHQLIAEALLIAAALLVLYLRGRAFRPAIILPGLFGFLAGSAPFWIWNIRNGWRSLAFLAQAGKGSEEAEMVVFGQRLLDMIAPGPPVLRIAAGVLVASVVLLSVALALRKPSTGDPADSCWIVGALLFLPVSFYFFAGTKSSLLDTTRYLLHLVAPLAVLLGISTAWLARRTPAGLGWAPLLVLLLPQFPSAAARVVAPAHRDLTLAQAREIGGFLRGQGIRSVLCNFRFYPLNFWLGEEFAFVRTLGERYPSYERQTEQDRDIAVMDDDGGIEGFLVYAGGTHAVTTTGGCAVAHDFRPPSGGLREIDPGRWRVTASSGDSADTSRVTDFRPGTKLNFRPQAGVTQHVEIAFDPPASPGGLRVWSSRPWRYPVRWQVDAITEETSPWMSLIPPSPVSFFFWSGPRPYWGGFLYRLEGRFAPRPVARLRISFPPAPRRFDFDLAELRFFEASDEPAPAPERIPDIVRVLQSRRIRHLYSDRWIGNEIAALTPPDLRIETHPLATDPRSAEYLHELRFSPKAALLVDAADAPALRRFLASQAVSMSETKVPPWTLFDFADSGWDPAYGDRTNLLWSGTGGLAL
jgi:4-amino-4-deoxy-L-arabinose transferase-like glycosyltransferase